MPSKNMPPNWQPPVDAWQSAFDSDLTEVVFAYFGCQHQEESVPPIFVSSFIGAIETDDAPSFTTRARYRDASGYENEVFIAYWSSRTAYFKWWTNAGFGAWFDEAERTVDTFGIWREIYPIPIDRFETLSSSKSATGVAKLGEPFGDPVREHNYWGGMRDRVPGSAHDDFDNDQNPYSNTLPTLQTRGQRIKVPLGKNICLIRSGQNWRDCDAEEIAGYRDEVVPHLTAGMAFLRDNPAETGCLSCRFMDEVSLDGSKADQSFGLAAFVSMAHLESWAKSHPTHLKIFNSFLEMVQRRSEPMQLKLWHEVLVTDQAGSTCEYVNCHPLTGFLPYHSGRL